MYNVFRKIDDPAIVCLIPDASQIPAFLRGKWNFDGKAVDPLEKASEFDRESARASLHSTGFYIFANP